MDASKCQTLKERLAAQPEPHLVPIAQFFDGNDDLGSIGCNLNPHPGINTFQEVLTGLADRPDIEAVYAQISELDPDNCWPFADTVLVAGGISPDQLRTVVDALQPDEVGLAAAFGASTLLGEGHGPPLLAIWWD